MQALWLVAADPDSELRPEEREHRARALRRGWFAYLNYARVTERKAVPLKDWLSRYAPQANDEARQ
jgi:hypothetical protein